MGLTYNFLTGQFDFTGVGGGGGGPSTATRYTATFNNTTDWGVSAPDYTFTVLATNHGKGITPSVQVFEDIGGGSYEEVITNITINSSGDVILKVSQSPDNRFNGLVLII